MAQSFREWRQENCGTYADYENYLSELAQAAALANAGTALGRLLADPTPEQVEAQMRAMLERARMLDDPAGLFATALVKVLEASHPWGLQAAADPAAVITCREASDAILSALEEALAHG